MSLMDYLLFAAVSVVQVGSPGPSTIYLVNNALVYGSARALWIVTGDLLAIAVLAAFSLLGVDALLVANPGVFAMVKMAGAAYLVWLGVQQLLRAGRDFQGNEHASAKASFRTLWAKSFVVGISNPKAILFFSSLLPQFLGRPGESGSGASQALIVLFVLIKFLVSCAYALVARRMASWLKKPGAGAWGKRATGCVLMLFGGVLAVNAFA